MSPLRNRSETTQNRGDLLSSLTGFRESYLSMRVIQYSAVSGDAIPKRALGR